MSLQFSGPAWMSRTRLYISTEDPPKGSAMMGPLFMHISPSLLMKTFKIKSKFDISNYDMGVL